MLDNPGVAAMVEHHALLYDDLRDPVALLREGRGAALGDFWRYAGSAPGAAAEAEPAGAYSALMSASQPMVVEEVADAYRFARHRRILDVGGGDGSFLAAIATCAPQASLVVFDVPPVAARARTRFVTAGLADRAEAIGGDFRADPLPAGADLVTLVRVLHDHDDDVVGALLRKVHAALAPGGRILVAEPLAGTPGAERMGAAYFGIYLLAMGQGRPRSAAEIGAMLREAGFVQPRAMRTRVPMIVSVIVAERAP
jgi:demethylspheroidene O-methyltransferase